MLLSRIARTSFAFSSQPPKCNSVNTTRINIELLPFICKSAERISLCNNCSRPQSALGPLFGLGTAVLLRLLLKHLEYLPGRRLLLSHQTIFAQILRREGVVLLRILPPLQLRRSESFQK